MGDKRKFNVALVTLKAKGATGELPGGEELDGDAASLVPGVTTIKEAAASQAFIEQIRQVRACGTCRKCAECTCNEDAVDAQCPKDQCPLAPTSVPRTLGTPAPFVRAFACVSRAWT